MNSQKPGTYAQELNKILKANKLPSIIIPEEETPSQPEAGAMSLDLSLQATPTQLQNLSKQESLSNISISSEDITA